MSVIFNCNYCEKEMEVNETLFNGLAMDFMKYLTIKQAELSEICDCRKAKKIYIRVRSSSSCAGNTGDLEFMDKQYEMMESKWKECVERIKSHEIDGSNFQYEVQCFLEELTSDEIETSYVWGEIFSDRDWTYMTADATENGNIDFAIRFTDKHESNFGEITVSDKPQKDCRDVFIYSTIELC